MIAAEQLTPLSTEEAVAPLAPVVRPALRPVPTGPLARPPATAPVPEPAMEPNDDASDAIDDNPSASQLAAARRAARRTLPAPGPVMGSVAMALLEIEAGCRSATQLERRCHPDLWERVDRRLRRSGGPFVTARSLVRVHCQELSPGLADGVAVVRRGDRVHAVAMRLDAQGGRWMVTELDF